MQARRRLSPSPLTYTTLFRSNPSSIYALGRKSLDAIDSAHEAVARALHCRPTEIVFTGGGSEADNLAIKGIAYAQRDRKSTRLNSSHPSISYAVLCLKKTNNN